MNTPTRIWIKPAQVKELRATLCGLLIEGEDAADLIDELHGCLQSSAWKRIGSADLEDIAGTMRAECEAFNEREIEIHELEMKGAEA